VPSLHRLTGLLAAVALSSASCGVIAAPTTVLPREAGGSRALSASGAFLPHEPGKDHHGIARTLRDLHTGLLPAEIEHVSRVIIAEARRANLSPALVLAVIRVESSGYNFARSHKGALGLMQLLPDTGAWVAKRTGIPWHGPDTLFDSGTNVRLGIAYLEQLIRRYGSVHTALAAYNWGPTKISRFIRSGQPVPAVYADRVLDTYGAVVGRRV